MIEIITALGTIHWASAVALCFASIFIMPLLVVFGFLLAIAVVAAIGIPMSLITIGLVDYLKERRRFR